MANANYPINSAGSAAFVAVVSACVFAFLVPVCNANGFVQPLVVGVAAGIFAELSRRYMVRKLVANRNATDADTLLDVYVNGAQVGTIAAVDVISLKLEALSDPRHYAAQFANIVGFAGRGALAALILMPLLLFWCCVISACVSPSVFQASMSMVAHLQPADLTRIAAQVLFITQILFMVLIGASFSFGVDLGLSNVFSSAVHRRIRLKINCATEGTLHFSPVTRTASRVQPA